MPSNQLEKDQECCVKMGTGFPESRVRDAEEGAGALGGSSLTGERARTAQRKVDTAMKSQQRVQDWGLG